MRNFHALNAKMDWQDARNARSFQFNINALNASLRGPEQNENFLFERWKVSETSERFLIWH
jgi:hypothetical protein